ncbi:MAG: DUF6932 family protein, partial [Acidimicrobiia bacterium]
MVHRRPEHRRVPTDEGRPQRRLSRHSRSLVPTWFSRPGTNARRRRLLDGLADALDPLRAVGCRRIWLNGSFVTAKEAPGDFDACWDPEGVDFDRLDSIFFDFADGRAAQKHRFGGVLPQRRRSRQRA